MFKFHRLFILLNKCFIFILTYPVVSCTVINPISL